MKNDKNAQIFGVKTWAGSFPFFSPIFFFQNQLKNLILFLAFIRQTTIRTY